MRRDKSNLPTYHGGNDRGKGSNERAAQAAFNGSADGIQRCSGFKDSSSNGGLGGGSSSKRRISVGSLDKVVQWRWMARKQQLDIGSNSHG
jgi:hypothetical protein